LIRALELSQSLGLNDVELVGDALMVIRQANSTLANGCALHHHATTFLDLATKACPARIRWIRRAQNLAGIALNCRHPR
jgi:ribonuclease HI